MLVFTHTKKIKPGFTFLRQLTNPFVLYVAGIYFQVESFFECNQNITLQPGKSQHCTYSKMEFFSFDIDQANIKLTLKKTNRTKQNCYSKILFVRLIGSNQKIC